MRYIAVQEFGVVLYLKQEGRGIGLLNKIRTYELQELGLDTVEANQYLDLPVDARDYEVAAKMIKLLKIPSVALLTNRPDKIEQLTAEGVRVVDRIPIVIPANSHDRGCLDAKKLKMRHMLLAEAAPGGRRWGVKGGPCHPRARRGWAMTASEACLPRRPFAAWPDPLFLSC
jgi:GTP cyclohydrolase II